MSNLELFAEDELRRAGLFDDDSDYGGMIGDAVMKMIRQFAEEGHSGFSAGMAISIFQKVARFEPLTPLTGNDDEWMEIGFGDFSTVSRPAFNHGLVVTERSTLYQNKRCSHVFKDGDYAYDIDGRIFRDRDGFCYTSIDSRVAVTFPYTPKREYVDVGGDGRNAAE